MEQFLVKQVKPNDFKLEARFTGDVTFYEVSHYVAGYEVETIEAGAFKWDMIEEFRINFVKLPSPDILIPSEEDVSKAVNSQFFDMTDGEKLFFKQAIKWYESRLEELNKHLNPK